MAWKDKGYTIFTVSEITDVTVDKSLTFIFMTNSIKSSIKRNTIFSDNIEV
jgi:hypothetical protein